MHGKKVKRLSFFVYYYWYCSGQIVCLGVLDNILQYWQRRLDSVISGCLYGWSAGTDKKYWSIAHARKHPWAYYQGGKVNWCSYILIFHGHNQHKSFSKLLFQLASIHYKIEIFEKYIQNLLQSCVKKSVLLSFLVILSLVLKTGHY